MLVQAPGAGAESSTVGFSREKSLAAAETEVDLLRNPQETNPQEKKPQKTSYCNLFCMCVFRRSGETPQKIKNSYK